MLYALLRNVTSLFNDSQCESESKKRADAAKLGCNEPLSPSECSFLSEDPFYDAYAVKPDGSQSTREGPLGLGSLRRFNPRKFSTMDSKFLLRARKKSTTSLKSSKSAKIVDENFPSVPELPIPVKPFARGFPRSASNSSLGRKRIPLAEIFGSKPPPLPPKDFPPKPPPKLQVLHPFLRSATDGLAIGCSRSIDSFIKPLDPLEQCDSVSSIPAFSDSLSTIRCPQMEDVLQELQDIEDEFRSQKVIHNSPRSDSFDQDVKLPSSPISPTSTGFRNLLGLKSSKSLALQAKTPPADLFATQEPSHFITNTAKRSDLDAIYDFTVYAGEKTLHINSKPETSKQASSDVSSESEPDTEESRTSIDTAALTYDPTWNTSGTTSSSNIDDNRKGAARNTEDGVLTAAKADVTLRRLTLTLSPPADGLTRSERRLSSLPQSSSTAQTPTSDRESMVRPLLLSGLIANRTTVSVSKEQPHSPALRQLMLPHRMRQSAPTISAPTGPEASSSGGLLRR